MKNILVLILLSLSFNLSAQDKQMFKAVKIDEKTKLVGIYSDFQNRKYEQWSFLIDDPAAIRQALNELVVGPEVTNMFEMKSFHVVLVQDNKDVMAWMIHPSLNCASYDGHTYKFDLRKLEKLSKKYPAKFRRESITFSSPKEYNQFLARQKAGSNFLYSDSPMFEYEGSFEIQFPRNKKFSSPKAISEYLTPIIQKIVSENEYSISYALNEKNSNNQDQFTMEIAGSKKLFEKLKLDGLQKKNWTPTKEIGYFYYGSK